VLDARTLSDEQAELWLRLVRIEIE